MMIYLQLFVSFFQVGLFAFGGGYAALPLIQDQVINNNAWLSMDEFTHLVTISQMTPGPIALNAATFVGTKMGGIPGGLVATAGCVAPSCIIVTILAILYLKYKNASGLKSILGTLRPATVALIASAGVSILITAFWGNDAVITAIQFAKTNWLMVAIFALSVVLLRKTKLGAVPVMILAGVLKLCLALIGIG